MGWNGSGQVVRTDGVRTGSDVAAQQKTAGIKVRSDLHDTEMEDLATAIELCVTRDGQNSPSANLPMNSFKHTGVTAASGGSSRTEYTSGGTVQDGAIWDAGDTGNTATAFTAVLSPAITAYANKQLFRVKFHAAFGATPTINFNTVGAKKMYYMVGSTATQLTTNNVPQNYVGILRYDTALDSTGAFLLLNPPLELRPAESAASESAAGIAELATQGETDTGTDDARIVTPLKLKTVAANFFTGTQVAIASDTARGTLEVADQSEMEAASSTTLAVTPGRQHFHPGVAKAWGVIDGTGTTTLLVSYNMTSITDNGTGDTTWTIATDFSSANYAGVTSAGNNGGVTGFLAAGPMTGAQAAGTFRTFVYDASFLANDPERQSVVFFGDQ